MKNQRQQQQQQQNLIHCVMQYIDRSVGNVEFVQLCIDSLCHVYGVWELPILVLWPITDDFSSSFRIDPIGINNSHEIAIILFIDILLDEMKQTNIKLWSI